MYMLIFGSLGLLLLIMGVFLLNGKGAFLIAGYNTLAKEEKAKYDEKALCRFVGWLMIFCFVCVMLMGAGMHWDIMWLMYCGIAFLLVATLVAAVYANTGNRFRNKENSDTSPVKRNLLASLIGIGVVFVLGGSVISFGNQEPVVDYTSDNLKIRAMYGLTVDYSEITGISLIEKSMRELGVSMRTNGYGGIGDALKGHFRSERFGDIMLFVRVNSSPTIRIERGDAKDIFISYRNGEATRILYSELEIAVKDLLPSDEIGHTLEKAIEEALYEKRHGYGFAKGDMFASAYHTLKTEEDEERTIVYLVATHGWYIHDNEIEMISGCGAIAGVLSLKRESYLYNLVSYNEYELKQIELSSAEILPADVKEDLLKNIDVYYKIIEEKKTEKAVDYFED